MKLLVVTTICDRSEIALLQGLAEAGTELELVCHPDAPGQDAMRHSGVRIAHQVIRHRLDLHNAAILRDRLRSRPVDVIYAPRNGTLAVALLASRGLAVRHVAYRGTIGHISRLDPASWLTYLHPRIDRIVCVSDAVRRYLLSLRLPPSMLTTIHKGHDVSWYEGQAAPDLASFGIPRGAFVVGFTGSMRAVKGIDVLIESLRGMQGNPPIHLLLVGEVRDGRIERLARRSEMRAYIHFTGFRRDAPALAGACHAYVMPSIAREGLPRGVIEAMAQGIPPVVTDVGGLPELVVDGLSGLVVPPRDPDALAHAIQTLATSPDRRREMGKNARERITTHFNIRTTIREMQALCQGLARAG